MVFKKNEDIRGNEKSCKNTQKMSWPIYETWESTGCSVA